MSDVSGVTAVRSNLFLLKSNSMKYKIEVGVDGPGIDPCADCIEVERDLSEKEHHEVLEAYDAYMWDEDILKDLFDDYLEELKQRVISIAMPLMTERWGDKAREENGARYYIFVPDEISEEYFETDAFKSFCSAQDAMEENCIRQSRYELKILGEGVSTGRWPHFKGTTHWELFECARFIGRMKASYCMSCQCNNVRMEYGKRYDLQHSEMKIEMYGNMDYIKSLIDKHLQECGREIIVKNMDYNYLILIPSKEDETDIQILLPLLDQLETDCVSA